MFCFPHLWRHAVAKNKQVCRARAIFAKNGNWWWAAGGRLNIGSRCKPGHVFCSQTQESTFTLSLARKQTHKGVEFFKRISKRVVDVKSASEELDHWDILQLWNYGFFTFVQLYMQVLMFSCIAGKLNKIETFFMILSSVWKWRWSFLLDHFEGQHGKFEFITNFFSYYCQSA